MKITESLIKNLIREEIENVTEMFGRSEDLPLPDDRRAALVQKTINGLRMLGPGAAARSDENIIAAIAELVADLGGTLPDASTMEEGNVDEMFDMSGRGRGPGHEASYAEKRKNKKTGPDHEEKMRKERERNRRLHTRGYEE